MPTITAQQILDRAERVLQDTTNVRWSAASLLEWLNQAQRAVVIARPDANAKRGVVVLATGTRQALPTDGYSLIRFVRNLGADGLTPGRAIRLTPLEHMDEHAPDWHAATPTAVTENGLYDPRDPRVFYVYPPAVANQRIEIVYSASPADCASSASVISVEDIYEPALMDYVLYRAFSEDYDQPENEGRAMRAFQSFQAHLGMKAPADAAMFPRAKAVE